MSEHVLPSSAELVDRAVAELRRGRPVVVTDDDDREGEGDLVMAAEHATAEWVAFFVRHTSGYLCVATSQQRLERLGLPALGSADHQGTAFHMPVDAKVGTTTGISAADRARTVRLLADDRARGGDFVRPGHVLTLRSREGGVLVRRGHTEVTVDLMRMAGLQDAGLLCEVVRDDGPTATRHDLERLAERHGLAMLSVDDVARTRAEAATAALRTR